MFNTIADLIKKLNGKTFTVFAAIIAVLVVFYFYGCESRTCSVIDPNRMVTRNELIAEVAMYEARVKDRTNDLDRQDLLKQFAVEQTSIVSKTGTFNPIGAVNSLLTIMAVGYAVDSKRKLTNANKANQPAAPA